MPRLASKSVHRGHSIPSLMSVHNHPYDLREFFLLLSIDLAWFATRIVFAVRVEEVLIPGVAMYRACLVKRPCPESYPRTSIVKPFLSLL